MIRLALAGLIVLAAGCGPLRPALTPSLVGIPGLSTDVVPERGGSAVVVTGRSNAPGVSGRALDRDTGAPITGLMVRSGEDSAVTDADGAFSLASAGTGLSGSYPGYLPFDAVLGADMPARAAVLIVMVRDPAAVEVTVQRAR